ncbi:MAG: DUF3427 domain-containing protein, partial [Acidimicrobiales bacterium]
MSDDVASGLYDKLIDRRLQQTINSLDPTRLAAAISNVDTADLPDRIAEVVASLTRRTLASVADQERAAAAIQLVSDLHNLIDTSLPGIADDQTRLAEPVQRLAAIEQIDPTGRPIPINRPITPLRDTVLMTNERGQPGVGRELAAEVDSADRIDLVLAFIRMSGIRSLLDPLRRHVEAGKQLRVLTTTYTASTVLRALEALAAIGADIKVSYDTSTTRLHAKAWLFQRATGFSTVYIGSSNLTFSAQVTGLEWNVRASQRLNPEVVAGFERTFATYWADAHFEPFDPSRFSAALAESQRDDSILTPFEIEPFPFQRQMLEQLQVERRKGRPHCLVAAATGTGKTIIAALDYKHLRASLRSSRLLFVAHRTEILEQSQATFRHVLRDGTFGELWTGGRKPSQWDHVFASVQSVTANDIESLDPHQFDVVIIDEFHHAAAKSYVALLDHLKPTHLLGLTATPERTDGLDVLRWFGNRIAVELRLWDALEQGLLAPFHYFAIHDGTDLKSVTWRRGTGYDTTELTNLYTADDIWASKIVTAVDRTIGSPKQMKALGFCVSIDHANFMAAQFQQAGLNARAVTSKSTPADRAAALADLRAGRVQILFTVDLLNEGVDIPSVDVVLMLRPTESATIFLQQLGRGLRKSADKDVLTVLDFVGHQNAAFRFDLRYRRMLGRTRRELESDITSGFPYLPAGCEVNLDRVATEIVLRAIREALPSTWKQRVAELRMLARREGREVGLAEYLHETGLDLDDLYRGGKNWTALRRAADIAIPGAAENEEKVGRGIGRLLHIDDGERIETLTQLLAQPAPPTATELDERTRRQLEGVLLTILTPRKATYATFDDAIATLWRHEALRDEIVELLAMLDDRVTHLHKPIGLLHPIPLQVHARYTREEVLAAFGASKVTAPLPLQTGVYWHEPTRTHIFFVTLEKSDKDYSPTTRYLDYAVSDRLFHWESQSTTAADSKLGRSYIEHEARGDHIALFVRPKKTGDNGRTTPYFCAGLATYVEHQSERP